MSTPQTLKGVHLVRESDIENDFPFTFASYYIAY